MTILELRNEIGTYNNLLNKYIQTFDLQIFNLKYCNNYKLKELRDYHEVKPELYVLLISNSEQIREYHKDYYEWKNPKSIAEKINVDLQMVIDYLNKNKSNLFPLTISFGITPFYEDIRKTNSDLIEVETEMKKISSYQILKDIQLELRWEVINKTSLFHK